MKNKLSYVVIFLAFMFAFSGIISMNKKVYAEEEVTITSKSAYLVEPNTGTVIYKKDELKRLPIASMTKIMTLLLCFENVDNGTINYNDVITVSENASKMGGSQIFLENGGDYSVDQLIKGIVVASANDACVALAEKLYGSETLFVDAMNKKSEELGMENTFFTNCTGLPKEGQYSCAKDVSTMFSELIKYQDYFNYSKIWMDKIEHPKDRITEISNTNKLIRFYEGCLGGKTGYTSQAGHCVCACANRGGTNLISVIISAQDSKTRFKEASNLFNFGFNNYCSKKIVDFEKPLDFNVEVANGKTDKVGVIAERNVYVFGKKNDKRSFEFELVKNDKINAPINKGDVVGKLVILENGIQIDTVNLLSTSNVECKKYFDYLSDCINKWLFI